MTELQIPDCIKEGNLSSYQEAYKCQKECWKAVKTFCIEKGLVADERAWYRLYQRLNCGQEEEAKSELKPGLNI